jgi:hypothetical protein
LLRPPTAPADAAQSAADTAHGTPPAPPRPPPPRPFPQYHLSPEAAAEREAARDRQPYWDDEREESAGARQRVVLPRRRKLPERCQRATPLILFAQRRDIVGPTR